MKEDEKAHNAHDVSASGLENAVDSGMKRILDSKQIAYATGRLRSVFVNERDQYLLEHLSAAERCLVKNPAVRSDALDILGAESETFVTFRLAEARIGQDVELLECLRNLRSTFEQKLLVARETAAVPIDARHAAERRDQGIKIMERLIADCNKHGWSVDGLTKILEDFKQGQQD